MMKRIRVLDKGKLTHLADTTQFESEAEFEAWLARAISIKQWGQPGGPELVVEDITAEIAAVKAAKTAKINARKVRIEALKAVTDADLGTIAGLRQLGKLLRDQAIDVASDSAGDFIRVMSENK